MENINRNLRENYFFGNNDQFLNHTIKHIKNVEIVALSILNDLNKKIKKNPSLKKHLSIPENINIEDFENKFKELIKIHDISKINTDDLFLIKHNLQEPIYMTLSKFAGVKIDANNRLLIDKINDIDKIETIEKAFELGMEQWEQDLYEFIEYTADIVERGCNPVTGIEMNKEVIKASSYKIDSKLQESLIKTAEIFYEVNLLDEQILFAKNNLSKKNNLIDLTSSPP